MHRLSLLDTPWERPYNILQERFQPGKTRKQRVKNMKSYILAHDVGTSGNKATLYDLDGNLKDSIVCSYPTFYPFDRAVEQNPDDWWRAVCDSSKQLLESTGISPGEIACVSFSGIQMGCMLVDREGNSMRNMIIWADTRSREQEKLMLERVPMRRGYEIIGHRVSASYPAAKLLWIKDNEREVYDKAYKMLAAKDYIILKLTGRFVTDYSDASGTNLYDLVGRKWSQELLEAWEIRPDLLPELHSSTDVIGKVTAEAAGATGLAEGTPVVMGGGDGPCSTTGAGCVAEGNSYCVIGSSAWIALATKEPYLDENLRTFNWAHLDPDLYSPCGTMQAAGFSYSWYRDTFCGQEVQAAQLVGTSPYKVIDRHLKLSPPGANGLIYLPYLLGERSPHWNHNARGAFVGMGISTNRCDFTRAVLEGVGFNLKIILDAFETERPLGDITMIGGGSKGREWLQILADIWQKPLNVPRYTEEATSMGAAVCGGVAIGAYKDFSVVDKFNKTEIELRPNPDHAKIYRELYGVFQDTYRQLLPIYDRLTEIQ